MVHEAVVHAHGHEHVTGEHTSTLELTSDDYLTPAGDCILGIEADTVPAEFDDGFVDACRDALATITATLEAGATPRQSLGRATRTSPSRTSAATSCGPATTSTTGR